MLPLTCQRSPYVIISQIWVTVSCCFQSCWLSRGKAGSVRGWGGERWFLELRFKDTFNQSQKDSRFHDGMGPGAGMRCVYNSPFNPKALVQSLILLAQPELCFKSLNASGVWVQRWAWLLLFTTHHFPSHYTKHFAGVIGDKSFELCHCGFFSLVFPWMDVNSCQTHFCLGPAVGMQNFLL